MKRGKQPLNFPETPQYNNKKMQDNGSDQSESCLQSFEDENNQTHEQLSITTGINKQKDQQPCDNNISNFSLSQTDMRLQQLNQIQKRRGRRGRRGKMAKQQGSQNSLYMQQMKQKKVAKIQQYEQALKKLRAEPKQFHQPLKKVKLNIDKQHTLQMCRQARDFRKNLRLAVRGVGIRHERNLFNCGVKDQLTYVIEYLETGKIQKWMLDNYHELLQKDLTKEQNIVQTKIQT